MRTYLGLLSAFVIAGSTALSSSCARDLWNGFVNDSEDSCVKVGCLGGGTCNKSTGYCEGGNPDMGTTPTSVDELFKPPTRIKLDQPLSNQAYLNMATRAPTSNMDIPEIWLSQRASMALTRLIPNSTNLEYQNTSIFVPSQPCFLTSVVGGTAGYRDVLVGQTGSSYLRIAGTGAMVLPQGAMLSGFKLLSTGDLNGDGIPDLLLTSSKLALGTSVYGGGEGKLLAWVGAGAMDYRLDSVTWMSGQPDLDADLISATIQHANTTGQSGFNVGLISAMNRSAATVAQLNISGGQYSLSGRIVINGPESDFVMPVDIDGDGLNDLLFVELWDGVTRSGGVRFLRNSGSSGAPTFTVSQLQTLPLENGRVLGAHIHDFDQDGFPDVTVLFAHADGNDMLLFRNQEAMQNGQKSRQLGSFGKMTGSAAPRAVEYVDVNRDGCKDMLMLYSGTVLKTDTGTEITVALGKRGEPGKSGCP